jgi:hypothetical protein
MPAIFTDTSDLSAEDQRRAWRKLTQAIEAMNRRQAQAELEAYGMGLKMTIMILLAATAAALLVFHFVTQDVTREEYKRHHAIEEGTGAKH